MPYLDPPDDPGCGAIAVDLLVAVVQQLAERLILILGTNSSRQSTPSPDPSKTL